MLCTVIRQGVRTPVSLPAGTVACAMQPSRMFAVAPNMRSGGRSRKMACTIPPMTERLYYHDAYLTAFDAAILTRAEDGRRVSLARTAFYPASGGQPFDTGVLGGVTILDVVDEGDRIAHLLERPVAGDRIAGVVDWPRRF